MNIYKRIKDETNRTKILSTLAQLLHVKKKCVGNLMSDICEAGINACNNRLKELQDEESKIKFN